MKRILSTTIKWITVITLIFPASPVFANAISALPGDEIQQDGPQLAAFGAPLSQRIGDGLQKTSSPLPLRQEALAAPPALSARSTPLAMTAMSLPENLALSLPPALKNVDFFADKFFASFQSPKQATNAPLLWTTLSARSASVGPVPANTDYQTANLTTITDEQGNYRFENLEKATHKITLNLSTLSANLQPVASEASPILWLNPGQKMTSEPTSTGVRFTAAYDRATSSISGAVFWDANGDGIQGVGEPGLSGVQMIDPGMHQYFVPFNDAHLWELLQGKNDCHNTPANDRYRIRGPLASFVFVTAGGDNTTYYYDHWEDGYDADPTSPGATTEVGVLGAGATKVFQSDIDPALVTDTNTIYYDGRDRITTIGDGALVVRWAYPAEAHFNGGGATGWIRGAVLAGAWEVPEVADWGKNYIATVGEDLDFNSLTTDDHDFSGLEVMALQSNTPVYLNGALVTTLNMGETYFIDGANNGPGNGGVDSGDIITATNSIQIQMMTGSCEENAGWSAHGYTLQPNDVWGQDYWAPVPGFAGSNTTLASFCSPKAGDGLTRNADTDIYLHNPHNQPVTVTMEIGAMTYNVGISPGTTVSVLTPTTVLTDISAGNQGIHLTSDDTFWGVSVIDTTSSHFNNTDPGGQFDRRNGHAYDWGYSLIPEDNLSSQVVVGYAPGADFQGTNPVVDNGNLAFVTPVTNAVIIVDLNQDGVPDPFDINGDGDVDDMNVFGEPGWDEPLSAFGIMVRTGQTLRVSDPDLDMSGASIRTQDPADKISVAWGQDPCRAGVVDPYLDLGYTVLPFPSPDITKQDELANDADASGNTSPGDAITYNIVIFNNGAGDLINPILTDTLPFTYSTFVSGSLSINPQNPPNVTGIGYYHNGNWHASAHLTATEMFTIAWDRINAMEMVTVTFRITLDTVLPPGVTQVVNKAVIGSDNTTPTPSDDPDIPIGGDTITPIGYPAIGMSKQVSTHTVSPGQPFTYTIVVSNSGNGTAVGLRLNDTLPPWIYYVTNTLNITWPIGTVLTFTKITTALVKFNGTYADDFDNANLSASTNYTGSDGSLVWTSDWTDDGSGSGAGDIQVQVIASDLTQPAYARLRLTDSDGSNSSVQRSMSLVGLPIGNFISPTLRYYISGTVNADGDDYYLAGTDSDGVLVQEEYNGTYTLREYPISPLATTLIFTAAGGMDAGDVYHIDNILIYDASPANRIRQTTIITHHTILTYVNAHGINPLSYNRATGAMVITDGARLGAGGFITVTFRVTSVIPLTNGLRLTNTATLTGANIQTTTTPLTDTAPVTITSRHALTITKSDNPDPVSPNSLLTYTLRYTVAGNDPAPNVVITDATPAGTTFASAAGGLSITAPPAGGTGVVSWYLGDLLPVASGITLQTGVVTMVVRVNSGISGTITNTAFIIDDTGLTDSDVETTTILLQPALAITKTRVTPSPVPVGAPVQFQIVVANVGNTRLVTVPLTDTYDITYLGYISATPASDDNINDGVINWAQVGPLNVRAQATITVNFTAVATTNLTTNTATASAVDEFNTQVPDVSDDATVAVTTILSPGIQLEKTVYLGHNNGAGCPGSQVITGTQGADITYCFVVTNTGNTWLQPITITDALLNIPPNAVTMFSGALPLAPGASAVYYFESTLTQGLINTAYVEGNPTDSNGVDIPGLPNPTDDDDAEVRLVGPGIVINKSINADRGVRGQVVTYTLRITNTGTIFLNPVRITDTLPPAMTYKNAIPQPDPPATGPVLVWSDLTGGNDFLPGESLTVTLAVTISTSITGTYTNVATTTGYYPGGSITDTGGIPIGVVDPSVELSKEIMTPGMVNGVITYAIKITNTGPSALDVVPVYDVFTGPVDYIGGWPEPNEIHNTATQTASGSIVWYDLTAASPNGFGINLQPNQSFLITTVFRLNIPFSSAYQITNTAVTSGSIDDQGNDANEDDALTAVDLLYFKAQKQSRGVLLSWATTMELDNYGFRLLRSAANNQNNAVSIAFIPAQGQGNTGGAYKYLDTNVRKGETYFYWLVDIDLNGKETYHGPQPVYYTPFFNLYLPLVIKQ